MSDDKSTAEGQIFGSRMRRARATKAPESRPHRRPFPQHRRLPHVYRADHPRVPYIGCRTTLQRRTQGSNLAGAYPQCIARTRGRSCRNLHLCSRLCSFQSDGRRPALYAHARGFVQLLGNLLRSYLLTSPTSASSLSSLQRVNSRSSHDLQPTKVGLSARRSGCCQMN